MKYLALFFTCFILILALSAQEEEKGANSWEILELDFTFQRNSQGKETISIFSTKRSPHHDANQSGFFSYPFGAFKVSDAGRMSDNMTDAQILEYLKKFLHELSDSQGPRIEYQPPISGRPLSEILTVDGNEVYLPGVHSLAIETLLKEGWEPLSVDNIQLPVFRGATNIDKEIHVFRRFK